MNTLADTAQKAVYRNGKIIVTMESGTVIRFPIAKNLRLACGTLTQLNNIEISPFGLHWPDLDEDLSFHGLAEGDFCQRQPATVAKSPSKYCAKKKKPLQSRSRKGSHSN